MKQTSSSSKHGHGHVRSSSVKASHRTSVDGVSTMNGHVNGGVQLYSASAYTNGYGRSATSRKTDTEQQQHRVTNGVGGSAWVSNGAGVTSGDCVVQGDTVAVDLLPSPISPSPSVDEMARHYFPVTLGSSYVLQASMSDGCSPPARLSESAVARGLAQQQPSTHHWQQQHHHKAGGRITRRSHGGRPSSAQSSSSSNSVSSIERMHLMTVDMPTIAVAPVLMSSPYQHELSQLRMERLRLEESHLLHVKQQDEAERTRTPVTKWYELRTPRFHYEAHKHNEHLAKHNLDLSNGDLHHVYEQSVLLRHQLSNGSTGSSQTHSSAARDQLLF